MHITTPKKIVFTEIDKTLNWTAFTDQVVGGFSKGELQQHEDYVEFSGSVQPILDKGWAGMRSKQEPHDLSNYKFIELKIKTDGQPYHFQMEHEPGWQNDKLGIIVDIVANKWKVMHLEMEAFKIYNTHHGFLTRLPKLSKALSLIYRYNFVAVHRQSADFNFQIEYIKFH